MIEVFSVFLDSLLVWFKLFYISIFNINTLWIIIPTWIAWFFAEIYQEKQKTSFGNAISNGALALWVGLDWFRNITLNYNGMDVIVLSRIILASLLFLYGIFIDVEGIRSKDFIHFVGRVRVVSYFIIMFTPFIYGIVKFDWMIILFILLLSPLFYFVIEFFDRLLPDPEIYVDDSALEYIKKKEEENGIGNFDSLKKNNNGMSFDGKDEFNSIFGNDKKIENMGSGVLNTTNNSSSNKIKFEGIKDSRSLGGINNTLNNVPSAIDNNIVNNSDIVSVNNNINMDYSKKRKYFRRSRRTRGYRVVRKK